MAQKIITIILGLGVVAALAWYINKHYIQPTSSGVNITVSASSSPNTQVNASQAGTLVYVNIGAAKEIWTVDSSGKPKKFFTDTDEIDKIMAFSNVATDMGEVLVATSSDATKVGGLEMINLSSAKTRKIRISFTVPEYLALSSDSSKFAYIRFSNVEASYGFTLYYESINNDQPTTVLTSDSEIITPAWSPSSTKITYAISDGTKTELSVYSLTSKKLEKIATLDGKVVDWVSWPEADKIIISTRKISDNNAGEIDGVNVSTGIPEKIVEFSGGRASFVYENKAAAKLAFIVAQYKNKIDMQTAGQVYVVNLSNKSKSTLEKANQILGWLAK